MVYTTITRQGSRHSDTRPAASSNDIGDSPSDQRTTFSHVSDKPKDVVRSGTCRFMAKAKICEGFDCRTYPAKVGNGDVAFIVEQAAKHFGDDNNIAEV
ncbi:hypothetical protein PG996_009680 [Apiospora saccharicola]|uniref:Ecp2 effector protein-like domain-containing protein n=1 Tax=Apiospora saccharicola TaxID=335842 RepID=A0ABR1UNV8_9PEZI